MAKTKYHRFRQIILYGWKDSKEISGYDGVKKKRISIFFDILSCFKKYYLFSNQYKKNKVWNMSDIERNESLSKMGKDNKDRDLQIDEQYANRKFLTKYMSHKYQSSSKLIQKRLKAYTERYHFGKNCILQHNVEITTQHCLKGSITVGNNVLFAKNVFIDYSGELIIHDYVSIANGVIIETHTHSLDKSKLKPVQGRLEICEYARILSRSYIADTCHYIGRYARIGAGSYVRNNIPPYAVVIGNPAKVIGFLYSPEEMAEFEKGKYSDSNRTPLEKYIVWYEKYFKNRTKEIKSYIKL